MSTGSTPPAEFEIDEALVRSLLESQHPDLADLPLERFSSGWDNEIYRLGAERTVRLPRREVAAELVRNEQRWLPVLAPGLPLPVPVPLRAGVPGRGYPWPWSVCPWFEGHDAVRTPPNDLAAAADRLGEFLVAVHCPAPAEAPRNEVRGVPLRTRAEAVEARFAALGAAYDLEALRTHWRAGLEAPVDGGPALWLQGDLHPANILVRGGEIAAVIDFGDITSGDRASDLSVAWMLFDAPTRERFRERAGAERPIDEATWVRARAWAVSLGLAFLAHSSDNATMRSIAEHTLRELRAESS